MSSVVFRKVRHILLWLFLNFYNMNGIVRLLDDIDRTMSRNRTIVIMMIAGSFLFCIGVSIAAFLYAERQRQYVYVLDHGKSLIALQTDAVVSKDIEVSDHVARFHELFFNLAPSSESIKETLDKAYNLADRSAYDYAQDLAEKGYYTRMVSANITQQIMVDSVVVDVSGYPYEAVTYGRLYVLRESTLTESVIETHCKLVDVARSSVNPHGLMIEGFAVTENSLRETRKR